MLPYWPRPSLEMGLGEVVVLLTDWYALSQHAHESIVGVVVDVGDATAGNDLIRANIRAQRARLGITQASVARRMRQLGYPWYPQTCGLVERNQRPLLADELA